MNYHKGTKKIGYKNVEPNEKNINPCNPRICATSREANKEVRWKMYDGRGLAKTKNNPCNPRICAINREANKDVKWKMYNGRW